jgi:hypothetical protein
MKIYLLLGLLFLSGLSLSAQCTDYQSELQNVETNLNSVIKNLKKAEKSDSLEKAQQYIDKAVSEADLATASANLAKEYASACDCNEGINSATTIYNTVFDLRTQSQKAADCGILEELRKFVKKALIAATSAKDETSEANSYCLE